MKIPNRNLKRIKYLIPFFLLSIFLADNVIADCTACWKLKGVVIQLKNHQQIEGYILWNKMWQSLYFTSDSPPEANFADSVLACFTRLNRPIIVYNDIRVFKNLLDDHPVALNEIDTISLSEIKSLHEKQKEFDDFKGASEIQIISKSTAELLQTEPIAVYKFDSKYGPIDTYLVSYNQDFGLDKLRQISVSDYYDDINDYEKKNVFFFDFSWD